MPCSALQQLHTSTKIRAKGIARVLQGHIAHVTRACLCHLASHECIKHLLCLREGPAGAAHLQDFYELAPHKFQNKTNGVTPRRWLAWCNPGLAALITETLGTDTWPNDLNLLTGLRQHADDKEFQKKWRTIKHENKAKLAAKIKVRPTKPLPCGQSLSPTVVTTVLSTACQIPAQIPDRASESLQPKEQGKGPLSEAAKACNL